MMNSLNDAFAGFGWGNFMQELVLDAYLAHKSGRAYVSLHPTS